MRKSLRPTFSEPAFVMNTGDLFHKVIVSDSVLFELKPDTKTILTFIAIRRAIGGCSIVYVTKTFQNDTCTSRSVQEKKGITGKVIDKELARIQSEFSRGVKSQTNYDVKWDTLDLSSITDRKEQCQAIKKWGKMQVC